MTSGELKQILLSPKTVETDGGKVENRSIDDIKKALDIIRQEEDRAKNKPAMARIGRYARWNE